MAEPSRHPGFFSKYANWLSRWYAYVLWISVACSLAGFFYSAKLYKNLRTDMEELLPETAQSVKDLKATMGRVGGLNHISVVAVTSDREAGRRFREAVAARFRALPPELVARVQDGIREEKAFFEANKALYLDLEDWDKIHDYVRDRIRYERRAKKNPFSLGLSDDEAAKPEFDIGALRKKYDDRAAQYDRFPDGNFESRDGRTHLVLAFLPGKVTDMASNQRLSDAAKKIIDDLNPKSFAPDMAVGLSGDVQNLVEEHHGLIEDLVTSFVICTLLVALVLLLFYRNFLVVYALCAALFGGTAWTFGVSYWLVGYLNANTAFLGSIVVGNGINFGIILMARYVEERRKGMAAMQALGLSMEFTSKATWTAALAAGLAYGSLVLTDFRGFNQFGIIGGIGMVLCWIATFTTLPAFVVWFEKKGWIKYRGTGRSLAFDFLSRIILKAHRPIIVFTLLSIVAAGAGFSMLSSDTLESDFGKLRNKDSMINGAGYWGQKVDAVFERYLTPMVSLTQTPEDAKAVASALHQIKEADGDSSPIADIKRVEDFLPSDQARKIRVISEIKERLPERLISRLSPEDRKLVDELLPKGELRPLQVSDLPLGVVYHFREMDGTIGRMVHVYPRLRTAKASDDQMASWDGKEVIRFAQKVREAQKIAGVPAIIAGQAPLSADMISAIATDGPKATVVAFLAVMILVLIIFPKWHLARSVLGALLLGVLWMGGLMGALHLKINFLNFIALPITFGIGVDYAVNIFSRYRLESSRSIGRVIASTGGAVALCSATTIIGYSSLLLAGSQAFVSFGLLAVLGEITCLVAALVSFPAIWHYFEEKSRQEPAIKRTRGAWLGGRHSSGNGRPKSGAVSTEQVGEEAPEISPVP